MLAIYQIGRKRAYPRKKKIKNAKEDIILAITKSRIKNIHI